MGATFSITFRPEAHTSKGAPTSMYSSGGPQTIIYPSDDVTRFMDERPTGWIRDFDFVEATVRAPDAACERQNDLGAEAEPAMAVDLVKTIVHNGRPYVCRCTLIKLDGRFYVPLSGRYAPHIEAIP